MLISLFLSLGGQAQAATAGLNKTESTLEIGKTLQLKVTGTKSKVIWVSSKKSVATVSTSGKVKAVKKGNTSISAIVNNKKYTCKVTVIDQDVKIEYLADRSVEYIKADKYHRLFFSLKDKNEKRVAADANVTIKIVNDKNETVYKGSYKVTKDNFSNWTSAWYGTRLLGSIDIPDSAMQAGSSKSGTIYFTITLGNNQGGFDESKLSIDNLPYISIASSCAIILPTTPTFSNYYLYGGGLYSSVKVENITYEFEESVDGKTVNLTIYFSGEMMYTSLLSDTYGHIGYKLSKDGYVIKSGDELTPRLSVGDKFKDSKEYFYGLEPGVYTLELTS